MKNCVYDMRKKIVVIALFCFNVFQFAFIKFINFISFYIDIAYMRTLPWQQNGYMRGGKEKKKIITL